MQLKIILYKLFLLIYIFFIYNHIAFGFSMDKKKENILNNNIYLLNHDSQKKIIKKFTFLKKNECFSFLKFNKNYSLRQSNIVIKNENFIGFLENERLKIFYIVKSGDTLYSISKYFGYSYYQLSKVNFIKKPYKIIVGQKIWIGDVFFNEKKYNCSIVSLNKKRQNNYYSCAFFFNKTLNILNFLNHNTELTKICFSYNENSYKKNVILNNKSFIFSNSWNWPVKSKEIKYFYNSQFYDKKMEISGYKGQPVFSAAAGEVVYISDSFKKYGKLIIIKHNDNYLSIYAFNDSILVKQKEKVYEQQKIATMGFSRENIARLYFEIRYKGESINPLTLLPKINIKK